jgi:hypothetical protein
MPGKPISVKVEDEKGGPKALDRRGPFLYTLYYPMFEPFSRKCDSIFLRTAML